jgi:hypothetical protein
MAVRQHWHANGGAPAMPRQRCRASDGVPTAMLQR